MTPRLLVGTRKGLFVWSRGEAGWDIEAVHFQPEPLSVVLPDARDGALYAALNLGHFGAKLRRLDRGASEWHECAVPAYPEGAEISDGPPTGEEAPKRKPATMMEIWSLESAGDDQPGGLWAGTIPGGLFRSGDRGESWTLVESLWNAPERWRWFGGGKDYPGIHSVSLDPRSSRRISVGVSCGGVWNSTDGGASWICTGKGLRAEYMPPNLAEDPAIQDPHRLARCADEPDTIWMQHHNGIFLSRDAGTSWRELKAARPAPFGFAVAAHPHDPNTAWFVPATKDECRVPLDARFVVSRTRDGGESFEVLSRGLPSEKAYDIVFRHAMDVDGSGRLLATGSTTGGLWISENSGDDWRCLSHTLPPIYCVRFDERG
jgi:hypothetical protein